VGHGLWVNELLARRGVQSPTSLSQFFSVARTPLHAAILNNNTEAFSLLLMAGGLNLELKDCSGLTVLWLALSSETFDLEDSDSYARRLVAHGSSPNTLVNDSGQ